MSLKVDWLAEPVLACTGKAVCILVQVHLSVLQGPKGTLERKLPDLCDVVQVPRLAILCELFVSALCYGINWS